MKRSLVLLTAAALASAAPAHAADGVSLVASSTLVRFQGRIVLRGSVTPVVAGEPVTILEGSKPVWSGVTELDGSFTTTLAVRRAAPYAAVAGAARSAPVPIRVRPTLHAGVRGVRLIGSSLRVSGRVLPHQAGRIAVRAAGRTYPARVGRSGRFRTIVPAAKPGRALGAAHTPRPRASGTHVEVYKSRQVAFEVRGGRVVGVTHVSTGATGNTPLGTWHVYRKVTGWDWVLWYPLYFHRGFALHGYPSVPALPASHGCVRMPMWFAPGFYSRWPYGATVHIFP